MNKIYTPILFVMLFAACKKDIAIAPPEVVTGSPITVTIDQDHPGYSISPMFEGLSYETQLLVNNPGFLNTNNSVLLQMIKNLGPGILRIGGNSSDLVHWSGLARNSQTPDSTLTTTDIDRLAAFSKLCGWKVLFGLNFGSNNIPNTVNEAKYAVSSLGSNLHSLQLGNEPDAYSLYTLRKQDYDYNAYKTEFTDHFKAVKAELPQVEFTGPGVAYNTDWFRSFVENDANNVVLLDAHYYNTGPAPSPLINFRSILSNNELPHYLKYFSKLSAQYQLPYRITETNSVYGGGKHGVSNVFAASLWALDMMWTVAESGGEGVNFHGGDGLFYSPVAEENGSLNAKPVYYAMLAFKYGNKDGKVLPATVTNELKLNSSTHASANSDNTTTITLINKELSTDIAYTINFTKTASSVQIQRLDAPSLQSADGITFAGSSVKANGTYAPTVAEQKAINGKSYIIGVRAGSAAVVTIK